MSKSPKKTSSWRTLMRRAATATKKGHASAAKRLKDQAASLRRSERAVAPATGKPSQRSLALKAAWAKRKLAGAAAAIDAGPIRGPDMIATHDKAQGWTVELRDQPGRGEIVGGELARKADEIAKLAKKRGGTDAIQTMLTSIEAIARHEGEMKAEREAVRIRAAYHRAMDDKIVCAFIALVDDAQRSLRGLPPEMVWSLDALTLTKIVDALNEAGYTAKGRRS